MFRSGKSSRFHYKFPLHIQIHDALLDLSKLSLNLSLFIGIFIDEFPLTYPINFSFSSAKTSRMPREAAFFHHEHPLGLGEPTWASFNETMFWFQRN
jgi:hypothetical protein